MTRRRLEPNDAERATRHGSASQDRRASLVTFGTRVRELRESASLSQQELAKRAGINRTTVSFIESGVREVGVSTVYDLAAALGVEPSQIFSP